MALVLSKAVILIKLWRAVNRLVGQQLGRVALEEVNNFGHSGQKFLRTNNRVLDRG